MVKSQPLADSLNFPFKRGEKLVYNVYFKSFITGKINAGEIIMEVKNTNRSINGRNTFHVECAGKSKRTFNWFMKVDDKFESYMDEQSLTPLLFIRQTREGHYKKDDHVEFLPHQNQAISRKKINKIPPVVHDILSACYYARTKDFSRMKPGEDFSLPIFFDDSVFTSRIVFHNREVVQTKMGSFNCISFRPMVLTGNVFSNRYPMTVWITDDENKIPLLVRSALILGRIEIELVKSSGLAFPLLSQVEKLKKEEMKN
jgi:hypothetical protein